MNLSTLVLPPSGPKTGPTSERCLISNEALRVNGPVAIVNESGLYSLILKSRKEEAKAFKKWVTKDVCDVLGLTTANLARDLDEDEKDTLNVSTPGGDQDLTIINESGLYSLIFLPPSSDSLSAMALKKH